MKKLLQIVLVSSLSLLYFSCYYDAYPEYDDIGGGGDNGETIEVSYSDDIVPLWAQCVGCHKGSTPPNLESNSYTNIMNGYVVAGTADTSILYMSLINSGGISLMPPGSPWPQTKIKLVKDWIDQGAKNN